MSADFAREIGGIGSPRRPDLRPSGGTPASPGAFADVLRGKLGDAPAAPESTASGSLRFSGHARERLTQRGIALTPDDLQRLEQGLARARAKGSRESLFLMRDLGFIVSVPQGTVITAMDAQELKDKVFTNIDSTLIL